MAKMEVPNVTQLRTRPSSEGLKYFDTPDYDNSGLLRGLSQLERGVSLLAQRNDVEKDKAQRFEALNQFNQFQIDINDTLRVQKETTQPGDLNFRERAEQTYQNYEEKFVTGLPPEYQEEFRYRAGQLKIGYLADVEEFNGKQLRTFGKNGVDQAATTAKEAIDKDSDSTDDQLMKMNELIDTMPGYSTVEKEQLKIENERQLRGLQYKKEYMSGRTEGPGTGKVEPGSQAAIINQIAQEIGADPTELATVMLYETIGKLSPSIRGGKKNRYIGLIQFGPNEQRMYGAHQGQTFAEQMQAVKRYLVDRGFKPGMGIEDLYSTINAGSPGRYKASDRAGANVLTHVRDMKKIYGAKAEALMGGKLKMDALDDDPRFALVPYEDRLALRKDGDTAISAQIAAQQAQQQAEHDAMMNQLAVDIYDGKAGRAEIDAMREAGVLEDIDDIEKLDAILKKREGDIDLVATGLEKLATNSIWDPLSKQDMDIQNALVKRDKGLEALQAGNEEYVNTTLLPRIIKTNDVPTDVSGLFTGMIRSNDPKKAIFALDTLQRISSKSNEAFKHRFSEEVESDVEWFHTMRGITDEGELLRQLRGGWTTEERNARKVYREEAQKLLSTPKDPNFVDFEAALKSVTPWFGSVELPGVFWAKPLAQQDFNAIFVDEYMKYAGNVQLAKDAAIKRWQRYWTVSDVSGVPTLTKYAPETVGYPNIMGDRTWIEDVARDELGLAEDTKIQFIGDETTKNEYLRWQSGTLMVAQAKTVARAIPGLIGDIGQAALAFTPEPRLPSYRVVVKDETRQQWVEARKPDGTPVQRMWFKPPDDLRRLEDDKLQMDIDYKEAKNYWDSYYEPANRAFQEAGIPIPDEVYIRAKELNERHKESADIFLANEKKYYEARKAKRAGKQSKNKSIAPGVQPAPTNMYRPRAIGK